MIRRGIHDVQNDNILPLVYTLEVEINVLDFDPRYPKNPQTVGEKIRKARMDRKMTLKEVAALLGVSDTYLDNNVHLLYIVHCLVNIKKGRTLCGRVKR